MQSIRRQRQIEGTRAEILEAAARAFMAHGISATTMHDIAEEAGYTAPSLYTYFENKNEIVEAFEENLQAKVFAAFDSPMPGGLSFRQQLELLLQRLIETSHETIDLFRAFFEILPTGRSLAAFAEQLERWMKERAGVERIGAYEVGDLAAYISGILHGLFVRWMHLGGEPIDKLVPGVLDFVFSGVGHETP